MEVATWNVWGSSARLHSRLLAKKKKKKKCQQFAFCLLQIKVISTQRVSPAGGEHPKYWGVLASPDLLPTLRAATPEVGCTLGLQSKKGCLPSSGSEVPNQMGNGRAQRREVRSPSS